MRTAAQGKGREKGCRGRNTLRGRRLAFTACLSEALESTDRDISAGGDSGRRVMGSGKTRH